MLEVEEARARGIICALCGKHIDEESDERPNYCSMRCAEALLANQPAPPSEGNLFIIRSERGLTALPFWIRHRKYNAVKGDLQDVNGKKMIGLQWISGEQFEKRGVIICTTEDFLWRAVKIAEEFRDE